MEFWICFYIEKGKRVSSPEGRESLVGVRKWTVFVK